MVVVVVCANVCSICCCIVFLTCILYASRLCMYVDLSPRFGSVLAYCTVLQYLSALYSWSTYMCTNGDFFSGTVCPTHAQRPQEQRIHKYLVPFQQEGNGVEGRYIRTYIYRSQTKNQRPYMYCTPNTPYSVCKNSVHKSSIEVCTTEIQQYPCKYYIGCTQKQTTYLTYQ